jgi:hypothetical protein
MNTYTDLRTNETFNMWLVDAVYACDVLGWPIVNAFGYFPSFS